MPTALGTVASHRSVTATGPIPTTGLAGWWDADDASKFTYSSGTAVSEWRDKSGGGHHFGQTLVQQQPARNGTMNGRTAVTFNGAGQHLRTSNFAGAFTSGEIFVVVDLAVENSSGLMHFWGYDSQNDHYPFSDGNIYEGWGTTARRNLGNPVDSLLAPHIYNLRSAPGSYVAAVNGAELFSTSTNTVTFLTYAGPLAHELGNGASSFDGTTLNGTVAEVVMYNRVLSTVERQQVESYLRSKWIIPSNPFTIAPWHAAYWASDPAWTPPADGAAVTTWRDGSGNGRDMTTSGGPLYRASSSVLGNKPAVDLNAPGKGAVTAALAPSVPEPFTMVGVYYSPTTADGYAMGARESSTWGMSVGFEGGNWIMRSNEASVGNPATAGAHCVQALWSPFTGGLPTTVIVVDGVASPKGVANSQGTPALKWTIGSSRFDDFGLSSQAVYGFVGFKASPLTAQEEVDLLMWSRSFYGTP
jgi:hypothetical protein